MKKIVAILLVLLVASVFVFATSKICSNGHLYTGTKCGHCEECKETYTKNGSSEEWIKQCLPSNDKN